MKSTVEVLYRKQLQTAMQEVEQLERYSEGLEILAMELAELLSEIKESRDNWRVLSWPLLRDQIERLELELTSAKSDAADMRTQLQLARGVKNNFEMDQGKHIAKLVKIILHSFGRSE